MTQTSRAVILIGDSHYAAIAAAAQGTLSLNPESRGCDLLFFEAWRHALRYEFTKFVDGQTALNPEMAQWIAMIAHNYDAIEIVTVFGGGHHLALTMLDNGHPMDVILPGREELPLRQDAMLVSVDFAKAIFLQIMQPTFTTLTCLREALPDISISQIECPPPNGDNKFVRARLGNFFESTMAPEQLDALSTPAQRYKFWRLQSEMYNDTCRTIGINYMPVPDTVVSEDGFLKPEHFGEDSTHANVAYGRLILDALEARLGQKFTAWNCFG